MARTARTWLLKTLGLIVLVSVGHLVSAAAAADLPRLWAVTGKDHHGVLYLLPVTHNGLEAEYDDYFYKTIVPLAMGADVFFREGALLVPSEAPACPTPLADTVENRTILRQAYADTERAVYDLRPPLKKLDWMTDQDWKEVQEAEHWFAHDPTSKLTEYGLIVSMGTSLYNTQLQHPEILRSAGYTPRPEVANYLAHERWVKGIKKNESIDTPKDMVDAYCSVDSRRRGKYLQRELEKDDPAKFAPISKEALVRGNSDFSESIQKGVLVGEFDDSPDDEYNTHLVCDRNEKWFARMRQGLSSGVTVFYALGAAHILQPSLRNAKRCDGLLARFRKAGFIVTLVR